MKILFLEDNVSTGKLGEWLINGGYQVDRAQNFIDACDYLESGKQYNAAIVDLDMHRGFLPPDLISVDKENYPGWVFYEHVLRTIEPLSKRTIILSALVFTFKENLPKGYNGECLISKQDPTFHKKVIEQLKAFAAENQLKPENG